MQAWLNLRHTHDTRFQLFTAGLQACGIDVKVGIPSGPAELFITWNRIGQGHYAAGQCRHVLVVENASWGNTFAGDDWYHIAIDFHNTAGCFPVGDPDRWDGLGVSLSEWRTEGETVILLQRGIGACGSPKNWHHGIQGRVRRHPGRNPRIPLEVDLANAGKVVTWGSGAAIKALIMGIPVESYMPNWIGQQDNTDKGRLAMFQRLAWAQWRHSEIESGEAFRWLIKAT